VNKPILAALLAAASCIPAVAAEPAGPADPAAAAPRPEYRSVFEDVPTGVEEGSVDWKKANAAVAEFPRGHIDLLKWEERQPAPAASSPPAPAPRRHQH
jgi:hypothetical protein